MLFSNSLTSTIDLPKIYLHLASKKSESYFHPIDYWKTESRLESIKESYYILFV